MPRSVRSETHAHAANGARGSAHVRALAQRPRSVSSHSASFHVTGVAPTGSNVN